MDGYKADAGMGTTIFSCFLIKSKGASVMSFRLKVHDHVVLRRLLICKSGRYACREAVMSSRRDTSGNIRYRCSTSMTKEIAALELKAAKAAYIALEKATALQQDKAAETQT